ncbi:MAG TPA: YaiO family outer membrane beta-barrel protein [Dissulfurispiraceae bacterium]|nr:YaiO family outer membrane beta-barrel protein [Dissulfurispiraceae bacterium]
MPAYAAETLTYDAGIEAVRSQVKNNDLQGAEATLKTLLKDYPDNAELLGLLANVLFWQKKTDEALEVYRRLRAITNDPAIDAELRRIETAELFRKADDLMEKGKYGEAEKALMPLFESGREQYEAGHRLVTIAMKQRDYRKAAATLRQLMTLFPDDRGFRTLYLEALARNGELKEAQDFLNAQPEEARHAITREREDLLYLMSPNYARLYGAFYEYTKEVKDEREISLEVSQKIRGITAVVTASHVSRFGLEDSALTVDIYSKLGEGTNRWGYLSLSGSPDADFLPEAVIAAEIFQGYRSCEFSLGYRWMRFSDTTVDIIMPGVTFYLPRGFTLTEKVYIVPRNWSASLLSTLTYEPNHRARGFVSLSAGKAAEQIGSLLDVVKVTTIAGRLGADYRWTTRWSAGADLFFEYREGLYNKYGITASSRFWW